MASAVALGDVTLAYSTLVGLGATNRQITVALLNVRAGDVLSVRPTGPITDGYDLGAAFCNADGVLTVIVAHPPLVINGSFSIPIRVFRIMT